MEIEFNPSAETREILDELADRDGDVPAKRIHGWIRGLCFESPVPQAKLPSNYARLSALLQRGTMKLGDRTVTAAALKAGADGFRFQTAGQPNGGIPLVVSKRLEEVFPLVISWIDLNTSPQLREEREWQTLEEFLNALVTEKAAEEWNAIQDREAKEQEDVLYDKPHQKKEKKPVTAKDATSRSKPAPKARPAPTLDPPASG